MRPVVRGDRPKNGMNENIQFAGYAQARRELILRMGEYCSYCEMHLDSSLAVEHVQPKVGKGSCETDQNRELDWNNFLLSCTNCNSTKSTKEVLLDDYLWPDRDNTFRALKYSEGGLIAPALDGEQGRKAKNTIKLTGLDKTPLNDPKASDRRWENRLETWDIALRSKNNLKKCNTPEMRAQISLTATAKGYWSVWMNVFSDCPDMLRLFIESFPGTCRTCFDENHGYFPLSRQNGQC